MGYFPMCVDLTGREVLLIGNGPQIADKAEKLRPFGPILLRRDTFHPDDLTDNTALVVVGDTEPEKAASIAAVCRAAKIPVNVVDVPGLSSFFFPAIIQRGDLTISVSTGGASPAAAGYVKRKIEEQLPDRTEEILDWLADTRIRLYASYPKEIAKQIISRVTKAAFELGRPLTETEMDDAVM